MSLINDALKRVSEAERGKPAPQTDFATRSLQPAEYERRSSPALWIMLPVLLVAVGVGGFLLAKQKQSPQPPFVSESKVVSQSQAVEPAKAPASTPAVQPTPIVAQAKPTSVADPVAPIAQQPATTSAAAADISTTAHATPAPTAQAAPAPAQPAPAPAPAEPTFRLKGILYTKTPTALINDGSVQVGGEIDGAKVTKIDRTSVELNYNGKMTVLKLGLH